MAKQTNPFANELTFFFFLILQLKILSPLQYFVYPVLIYTIAVRSLFSILYCVDDISLSRERQNWENRIAKWRKNEFPTLVLSKTFDIKPFSRTFWKLSMKKPILTESSPYHQLQFRDLVKAQRKNYFRQLVYKLGYLLNGQVFKNIMQQHSLSYHNGIHNCKITFVITLEKLET